MKYREKGDEEMEFFDLNKLPVFYKEENTWGYLYRENGAVKHQYTTERFEGHEKGIVVSHNEHLYLSLPHSPDSIYIHNMRNVDQRLQMAFMTAEKINDLAILENRKSPYMQLILPNIKGYSSMRLQYFLPKQADEVLNIEHSTKKQWVGRYMVGDKELFTVEGDYDDISFKAQNLRYLYSAYRELQPNECMGIRKNEYETPVLLAASCDNGISIREIPNFRVHSMLYSIFERPPFFMIEDGVFSGITCDSEGKEEYVISAENGLLLPFVNWMSGINHSIFEVPQEIVSANNLVYSIDGLNRE